MAIKRNIKLTTEQFLRKVYRQSKEFEVLQNEYNSKLEELAQVCISSKCKYRTGDIITFKNSDNGFKAFKIERIVPDINWNARAVRFQAIGEFSGPDTKSQKGAMFLDDLKPVNGKLEEHKEVESLPTEKSVST